MNGATLKLCGLAVTAAAWMALPTTADAQETQRRDTTGTRDTSQVGAAQMDTAGQDTSQWGHDTNRDPNVQNPPGYRGMERPVNVFPPDSAEKQGAGQVEDQATGTYDRGEWQDTSGQQQNPAGYRGMERPAGLDTTVNQQELDQYRRRLGEMGYKVEKMSKSERRAWTKANARTETGTAQPDTTRVGETTPRVPSDSVRRLPAERGDTTGNSEDSGSR